MASSFEKLKELDLSRDEVDRIGEVLKKKEFRDLLAQYVEEIQDPENKKLYEKEITQLEKERGVDISFIHPKPGYVIKTSVNGNQKAFINICVNDLVGKPSSSPAFRDGSKGLQWSLPHSLSPPREDVDNKGMRCQVFDVVFNTDTLHLAEKNKAFRSMVNTTACEAVESNFDVKLDKKNLKFPKLQYKGMPHASVIRKPSKSKPLERSPEEKELYDKIYAQADNNTANSIRKNKKPSRKDNFEDKSNYATPKYLIKHRNHIDIQEFTENRESKLNVAIPKELIVEINLPLLKSSTDIELDVTEKTVQLKSEKPAKYKLDLTLPYCVNEACGNAKFDKDLKKLVITLPVRRIGVLLDSYRDDSGVDSDHASPASPDSEDETFDKPCISELELSDTVQVEPSDTVQKSKQFRTKFLDESIHYNLPEFTCHVFENVIAFTLNVKNVDENSIGKFYDNAGSSIHVKFTSISSSFYTSHYAFYVKIPLHSINSDNVIVETWDNNIILQLPYENCDKELKSYLYGVDEENLSVKYIDEPSIINEVLQNSSSLEIQLQDFKKDESVLTVATMKMEEDLTKESPHTSESDAQLVESDSEKPRSKAIDIIGTSYESSGDELSYGSFSPTKNRGILKKMSSKRPAVARSISESSLDDYICSSSFENCHTSLDSVIPEDEEVSTSLKKTVRFNDVVTRQLFRSNSSILGQKKKNQRKARNKKRAQERRHSESEATEDEDKREGELKTKDDSDFKEVSPNELINNGCITTTKKDDDIFDLDMYQ